MIEDCNNGSCHECPISKDLTRPGVRLIDGSLISRPVMSSENAPHAPPTGRRELWAAGETSENFGQFEFVEREEF